MNVKKLALLAGATLFLVSGLAFAAGDGKDVIKIDSVPGKKGAVTFAHAKHQGEYKGKGGKAITCKDCHHTLKADKPAGGDKAQACTECHVKPTEAQKGKAPFLFTGEGDKIEQKSVVFHKTCIDCHKAMKAEGKDIGACKTCHK